MPSNNLAENIKWYESYWMRQYKAKYTPADPLESDGAVAKDAFKYVKESKRLKKTESERKDMIMDIKYYRMRWGKVFNDTKLNPKDPKLNEKVLAVLIPMLIKEKII